MSFIILLLSVTLSICDVRKNGNTSLLQDPPAFVLTNLTKFAKAPLLALISQQEREGQAITCSWLSEGGGCQLFLPQNRIFQILRHRFWRKGSRTEIANDRNAQGIKHFLLPLEYFILPYFNLFFLFTIHSRKKLWFRRVERVFQYRWWSIQDEPSTI